MDRWSGKVAIVTGASSGIGSAIVEKLVNSGLIVVGLARKIEKIEEQSNSLSSKGCKGKLHAFKCDVMKEEEILKAFEWTTTNIGLIHILVNNAGVNPGTNLIDGITTVWRQCFETNVIGLLIATREATRIMREHKIEGHIVNVNSVMGHADCYIPSFNVYPATKHAITNLNFYLRQELAACGVNIKVSSISPGLVETNFFTEANMTQEEREQLSSYPHLHKNDVADAIMYVLSTPPNVHVGELIIRPEFSIC